MFIVYFGTKFHVPNSNDSLFIAIKTKARFRAPDGFTF
jgi:hypothetical protein